MSTSDAYESLELIGHGSFGQIRKVRRKQDGLILVRKEISYLKMSTKEKTQLQAEFKVLEELKHPNIVRYFHRDHIRSDSTLHLYMEYCGNGDLGGIISKCRNEGTMVPEHAVWSIFTQLVLALYRCHNGVDPPECSDIWSMHPPSVLPQYAPGEQVVRILHRDLKPENVFLGQDNDVKLGDFGLSKMLDPEQHLANTFVGTPYYMSPEIVSDQPYTHKSDIWSLGCIIYELCALSPPFNAKTQWSLISKIKEGRYPPMPGQYSATLRGVVDTCLRVDQHRRPDTAALLGMDQFRLSRRERDAVCLNRVLKARDESLKRKEQQLAAKADEYRQAYGERAAALRAEIDAELRAKWEVLAQTEIQRQVERLEREVEARVDAELDRRWNELERARLGASEAFAGSASTASSSSSSSSSSSGASSGYEQSPPRLLPGGPTLVPDSPADVDMASPSAFQTPGIRRTITAQEPPRMPLQPMLPPARPELPHQLPQQSNGLPRAHTTTTTTTTTTGFRVSEEGNHSNNSAMSRVSAWPNGSPVRLPPEPRRGRTGLQRAGTTGLLFGNDRIVAGHGASADDIGLARSAAAGGNQLRGTTTGWSLLELARMNNVQKTYGKAATYDPATEELPSPWKKEYLV